MLLIIPLIEIQSGKTNLKVQGISEVINCDDPVEIARLWRKENAKSLHITDVDGAIGGKPLNLDIIEQIIRAVDVPVEISGGLRTFDDVKDAFGVGVYRVVINTMFVEDPDTAKKVLDKFGASSVTLGLDVKKSLVRINGRANETGLTSMTLALNAKQMGFRRIVYTDVDTLVPDCALDFVELRTFSEKIGMRVTVSGGIWCLEDLLKLQELESCGVDSVVIGRALCENRFACQGLWRVCEVRNYPFTAKV